MSLYDRVTPINKMNELLNELDQIEDIKEQRMFLQDNIEEFWEFRNNISTLCRGYLFKEKGDLEQNELSDKLHDIIMRTLMRENLFESEVGDACGMAYYKGKILETVNFAEGRYAFKLAQEQDMDKFEIALEYINTKKAYADILERMNFFEGQGINERAAKSYISNKYEQNMFGHMLMQIKSNFASQSKEDIMNIVEKIDNSNFFSGLFLNSFSNMSFWEQNLAYQYSDVVLKMKSIFTPDKLKDDPVVRDFWNGKIQDEKIIQYIAPNVSLDTIYDLLQENGIKNDTNLYGKIADNFKEKGLNDKNIQTIMNECISNGYTYYNADLLAHIDIPRDYKEFFNSEYVEKYSWLMPDMFEILKKSEKRIEDARDSYLPAVYYEKKMNKIQPEDKINKNFFINLDKILDAENYYKEEDKQKIKVAISQNYERLNLREIKYLKHTEDIENVKLLIKYGILGKIEITEEELKWGASRIIENTLQEKGVENKYIVLFGNGQRKNFGYHDSEPPTIWLDENLVKDVIDKTNNPVKLFDTMFHEMQHAIQTDNINKGKIDYLTYNCIKENIIKEYDSDFYNMNYSRMYGEIDARKNGILGMLDLFKSMRLEFGENTIKHFENQYIKESETHTIYNEANKRISIGEEQTMDISTYLGRLINDNPEIIKQNPILEIEYHSDGSKKSLIELLNEFEQKKLEQNQDYKNLYSIYYGVIDKEINNHQIQEAELQEKISVFQKEAPELITMEDMFTCYHEVDKADMNKLYSRIYSYTRRNEQQAKEKEADENDNSTR